jgi:putative hemolysin
MLKTDEQGAEPLLIQVRSLPGLPRIASKLLPLEEAADVYRRACQSPDGFTTENLLAEMKISVRVNSRDVSRIPATGPVVVVANHPFGLLDGAALSMLLSRVRPDVRVLTNSLLADIPALERICIFVDPFGGEESRETNLAAVRQALAWLRDGGMLGIFPAGEVSHWRPQHGDTTDPLWNTTAARLVRKTGAISVPVFFCGGNSLPFHLLGMMHPRLRTTFLLQEFLKQRGKTIEVRIGKPIAARTVQALPDDREATEHLRWRTYLLGLRGESAKPFPSLWPVRQSNPQPICRPVAPADMAAELESLPADRCLAEVDELAVWACRCHEAPHLVAEIGRLREVTFRAAGEGTGKSSDLDRFDLDYWHFVLWNRAKGEVAGAYRAANTAEIIARRGVDGLYTNTLFRFDPRLFQKIGPALELGRSFVVPEYQRRYTSLLLLWKGIAAFVAAHAETAVLFGPVSISNSYSRASRELIFRFFSSHGEQDGLTNLVRPRRPFRTAWFSRYDWKVVQEALSKLGDLSESICDLEVDGKGLPILLKHYVSLGGKMLAFNVDPAFSDVLDGLIFVDLRRTDPSALARFMGPECVTTFRRYHHLDTTCDQNG